MPLCPASVTARANSDLLRIEHMIESANPMPERMALIIAIVHDYERATAGSTERACYRDAETVVNPYERRRAR